MNYKEVKLLTPVVQEEVGLLAESAFSLSHFHHMTLIYQRQTSNHKQTVERSSALVASFPVDRATQNGPFLLCNG